MVEYDCTVCSAMLHREFFKKPPSIWYLCLEHRAIVWLTSQMAILASSSDRIIIRDGTPIK